MPGEWPPWSAPLALLTGFGGALVGGLTVAVAAALTGASLSHPPPEVDIVSTLVQDAALMASAVFFASRVTAARPASFGLVATAVRPAVRLVALAYGSFLAFSIVWAAALNIHDKEKIVDQLGANRSDVALVAVMALTCVIAPVAEEFFFRGYFYAALRNWRGVWPAALLTGLVFGAIHIGSAPAGYLVPLAVFGVLLCLLYQRTGSLYPCIGLHVLNNSVAFGITEHWGWQIPVLAVTSLAMIAAGLWVVARRAAAD